MSSVGTKNQLSTSNLAAVVVNMNGGDEAAKCIRSLLASSPMPGEVVVVDNGSTDSSVRYLREMEGDGLIRLIALETNVGLAKARNLAVNATALGILAFLDNDTTFDPGWAGAALEVMDQFDAACVQCKLLLASDPTKLDSIGYLMGPLGFPSHIVRLGEYDSPKFQVPMELFGVKAAGMVVRKSTLISAGCFDESYFIYGEETDLCWRIQRAGGSVYYAPRSLIYHNAGGTRRFVPDRAAALLYHGGTRNYIRTVAKNSPAVSLPKDVIGQVAVWTCVAAYCALRSRKREAWLIATGVAEAISELPRLIADRRRSSLPFRRIAPRLRMRFNVAYLRKVIAAI